MEILFGYRVVPWMERLHHHYWEHFTMVAYMGQ